MSDEGQAQAYLDAYLAPLARHLGRNDVTDIYVNRPGELWVETLSGELERHYEDGLGDDALWRLARQIASLTHQGVSREHPLMSARLPDGSRIQIVAPPATRGSMAIAIRKHAVEARTLSDYLAAGAFERTRFGSDIGSVSRIAADEEIERHLNRGDAASLLRTAVQARKNIVVSGGTSTGKTTFLNMLLGEVAAQERILLIEDTPELKVDHENAVGMVAVKGELGEARVGTDDLLQASLRMRPDRIILGELRGKEAYTFLRAVNTGHPGSMTTVHADSPAGAVHQLALIILQSGAQLTWSDVERYVENVVDVFVQLGRAPGRRFVDSIVVGESSLSAGAPAACRP